MKRALLLSLLVLNFIAGKSQVFQSYNINMISHITPNMGDMATDGRQYSGCWGWYQASKNKEYAISGTSNGTYFIDVTVPSSPTVSAFVQGMQQSTYREMKTYQNYCYIVSDESGNVKFQIVDMQYLPDSIHIVYNDSTYFKRGHTIWIDQDKMYIGAMLDDTLGFSPMAIFSLATPTAPVLLRKLQQDIPSIDYVHDMYVRNDTIYASCAYQGLYVFKYNNATNTITQLGSYKDYQSHGFNHSSFLTQDGKHLIFCDEVPGGLPVHFVNVQNLGNIQPVQDFHPMPKTTPHNPFIKGNFAIVSSYQDGLFIYDISQPNSISLAGYFDTFPQGGVSWGNDYGTSDYRGNWGAYPFLPSGIVIANDMQNGTFILDATSAYTTSVKNPVGLAEQPQRETDLVIFPNPVSSYANVYFGSQLTSVIEITNILGQCVFEKEFIGNINASLDLRSLENGTYTIAVRENNRTKIKKLIVNH
ncbi:MAG: choice-of-anchor B family protein [Bacteroidia bacterium]|nr:choice-of-anchor B family protein [Bacteroidia bacterium]